MSSAQFLRSMHSVRVRSAPAIVAAVVFDPGLDALAEYRLKIDAHAVLVHHVHR
jgi:hypothetical protein